MSSNGEPQTQQPVQQKASRVVILFGPPGSGKGTLSPTLKDRLKTPVLSTGDVLRQAVADKTVLGLQAASIMRSGQLVPDEMVIKIIKERITHEDCAGGFILDGFPRTVEQARALDQILRDQEQKRQGSKWSIKVFALEVPDAVLHARIAGRWIHKQSGRSYHLKFAPPKSLQLTLARKEDTSKHDLAGDSTSTSTMTQDEQVAHLKAKQRVWDMEVRPELMLDDETGQPLSRRPDDNSEALQRRLDGYRSATLPILEHYAASRPPGVVSYVNASRAQSDIQVELLSML